MIYLNTHIYFLEIQISSYSKYSYTDNILIIIIFNTVFTLKFLTSVIDKTIADALTLLGWIDIFIMLLNNTY